MIDPRDYINAHQAIADAHAVIASCESWLEQQAQRRRELQSSRRDISREDIRSMTLGLVTSVRVTGDWLVCETESGVTRIMRPS